MADSPSREPATVLAAEDPTASALPAIDTATALASMAPGVSSAVGTPGGPATGTVTPALSEMPPEQVEHSLRVSLADLCARAGALYAARSYEEAAETYARAAEMQAEMNGEMDPANADILFQYGRALFRVGQGKSDVLGGKAPAEGKKEKKKTAGQKANGKAESSKAAEADQQTEAQRVTEEGVAILAAETGAGKEEAKAQEAKKPLFQFTGDENWDDSDEEEGAEGDGAEGEGEEEEEDDLAVAFEILDLSRVLFEKRLEADQIDAGDKGKGKETVGDDSLETKHIKERLADTHDLVAEISLENERFPNAITDFEASLKYKEELYPAESEVLAEAHFKLYLALEAASTTSEDTSAAGPLQVDQDLRDKAVGHLETAIASTKQKLQNKEVDLATMHSPDENEATRKQIAEVKDMIAEMETRLVDLKKAPIDLNTALGGGTAANAMGGILGATLGESPAQTEARIEEAKKTATDLTGVVRKKAKAPEPTKLKEETSNGTNGKRKAEEEPAAAESDSKKAKVEEAVGL